MKAWLIVLPLLILLLVVLAQSRRTSTDIEPPGKKSTHLAAPAIAWKQVAAELETTNPQGQIESDGAYGRFLVEIETMDSAALLSAWNDLQSTDLPQQTRERFSGHLLGMVFRKEPENALRHFADEAGDPGGMIGSLLFGSYRDWAAKSTLQAARWLDATTAAGTFGPDEQPKLIGETPVRVIYERELIRSLLLRGAEPAAARIDALPEKWRVLTLRGADSPQNKAAFATLVRRYLSADEQAQEFVRMASSAAYQSGPEAIHELLDQIHATPKERTIILNQTLHTTNSSGP